MAVVADRVVVELEARLDKYNADLKRAERVFSQSTQAQSREIKRLEQQISRSSGAIGSQLRGLAGAFAAAFSARQVQELADGFTRFQNQLAVAGVEGERLATVQRELFASAQQYGVALESLGTLYSRGAQVAGELGATQADLLKFTNGVAAALKIQGTSATEAQGALLQLSQALGSGTVRAEEFNSINEGALPILKAVAQNMDAAGGSVAKLKSLVNEGKVSSEAFFTAFLAGSAELEAQASKATLTIGNSFTVLNNALGLYIGQADDSLSATERISAAIISLSENLDTVVTALGVISAVLLGRYVAGAVAAAAATGATSTAIFALQARALGAATTMEALAFVSAAAGRTMLAAFGGPVGIAVAALAVGVYYLATRTEEGAQASESYATSLEQAKSASERAAGAADTLATATGAARDAALDNAAALREETVALRDNAKAALQAAIAKKQDVVIQNRARLRSATQSTAGAGSGYDPALGQMRANQAQADQAQADVWAAVEAIGEYNKQIYALDQAINAPPPTPRGNTPAGNTRKPTGKSEAERMAEQAAKEQARAIRTAAQVENEIAQLAVDRLQTIADLTGTADDRAVAAMAQLQADRAAFERAISLDEDLTEAQRAELRAAREAADAERARAVNVQRRQQLADEALAQESAARQTEADIVRARGQAADRTARQRRETEQALIDLQFDEERAQLEGIVASEESTQVERDIAQAKLDRLEDLRGLALQTARLRNQSPFEAYMDELNKSEAEIQEDMERIAVDGLESLNDGITDVITGAKSLEDVFSNVADQIISDLIRIAVQQALIKPLADALGLGTPGGGGAGGALAGIGSFFSGLFGGRASGGHVVGGNMYRVTDGEGFVPAGSGKIIPLGQMRQSQQGGGAGGGAVRVEVALSGDIDARIRQVSGPVAVQVTRAMSRPIVESAVAETFERSRRPNL